MRNSQLDISSTMERHPTLHTPAWPKFNPLSATASEGLWPPRSPDLTPLDYFLWGYLKGRVYQNKPRTIEALKANITEEIQAVTADVLARTFQNMARRFQSCLDANGGHFQHVLWCRHISCTMRQDLFKFRCNILISGKIIKEMPGSVASGTLCIRATFTNSRLCNTLRARQRQHFLSHNFFSSIVNIILRTTPRFLNNSYNHRRASLELLQQGWGFRVHVEGARTF